MIKIKNSQLSSAIDNAIIEYNNQFYREEDSDKLLDYYDEENGISEETLKRLPNLRLQIQSFEKLSEDKQEELREEIKLIVGKMSLDYLAVNFTSRDKRAFCEKDLVRSLIENLNLTGLEIAGVDLGDIASDFLSNQSNPAIFPET